MRRFARTSQRFGSQPAVECGFALYPGSTRLITAARLSPHWRSLSSSPSSYYAEQFNPSNIPHIPGISDPPGISDYASVPPVDDPGANPARQRQNAKLPRKWVIKRFWYFMKEGQPDHVMDTLLRPYNRELVEGMSSSSFAEVFRLLSPEYFIKPFRTLHEPMHPTTVHVRGYKRLEVIFNEFVTNVVAIAEIRRSAGRELGLAEYTHLLYCASSVGDALLADQIWHNMQEDRVRPDISCYNHLMSAKVSDGVYTGRQKYRLRTTRYIYHKRGQLDPNCGWEGHGTKERSVRKEVVRIMNEMIEAGFVGDEDTFIQVMISSSRVGSAGGVRRLLKAVWDIDADELLGMDTKAASHPFMFPPSSPFHPTKKLLFAVAHSFGTTNDIRSALWLVELISSSYGVRITKDVWLELLRWSFVLSRRPWGPDIEGKDRGLVNHEFVFRVYDTMTSEPFKVHPTAHAHMYMAKTAWDICDLSLFRKHLDAAYDLLAETRTKQRMARSKIMEYVDAAKASHGPKKRVDSTKLSPLTPRRAAKFSPLKSRHFGYAVYKYDLLRLRALQQATIVQKLVRLLIIKQDWIIPDSDEYAWERRLLPQAIEEWEDFLPDELHYHSSGGMILRKGFSTWRFRRLTPFSQIPIRRPNPEVGLQREVHPDEVDDDVFWARLLQQRPDLPIGHASFLRLFDGVVERSTVAHPQPFDPFTYEPLADCKTFEELREFYRQNDARAIKQYVFQDDAESADSQLDNPEWEDIDFQDYTETVFRESQKESREHQEESELEDPTDPALPGLDVIQ